ncbi:MAG TPA: serine/threonine-protein kinase [Gemmatimonadales bacterium]|nr:serine/threonine-protein kinase [Gemmatimonadales bacterium]
MRTALDGRYTVARELGHGGMATVYLAQDVRHRRAVALKVLRPDISATIGSDRFIREIEIVAGLAHPHILPLFDSGEADGLLFFVMPFAAGESLRDRLIREHQLPVAEALRITRGAASALAYAHSQGIIHRDIKPENILLEGDEAVVADFGIARVVDAAHDDGVSLPGVVVGTPAYMSPEQAMGVQVDGRSDVYSLGCVLFEMLAGKPPFRGESIHSMETAHRTMAPPRVSGARATVSPDLQVALDTAMAKLPADRYRSAWEFTRALDHVSSTLQTPVPHLPGALPARKPKRALRAGVAAALLILLAVVAVRSRQGTASLPALSTSRFVVLPFLHAQGGDPLLDGDECENLLYDAMSYWSDIELVNSLRVNDALQRLGQPPTLSEGLRLARGWGAGRLVWGEVSEFRDTVRIRATLFDVEDGGALREARGEVSAAAMGTIGQVFAALRDSLVLGPVSSATAASGITGTNSLAAWKAFQSGDSALAAWDLGAAQSRFREALRLDAEYPQARLWLAQTQVWEDASTGDWKAWALRARSTSARLTPHDSLLADALASLADGDFVAACDRYRALLRRDSSDFAAWFGLGECHAADDVVIPDQASPSGWRFRSGYQTAIHAYRQALRLVPSVYRAFQGGAFIRLQGLFFAESNAHRVGRSEGADTRYFAAFPALADDTLAFVPWPEEAVMDGTAPFPRTQAAAVARNRRALRDITAAWVSGFPDNATAWVTHAGALEVGGELASRRPGDESALTAVAEARRLTRDSTGQRALMFREMRLRLKTGEWALARSLAESLLAGPPAESAEASGILAGAAALLGKVEAAALHSADASATALHWGPRGSRLDVPARMAEQAARLLAYASFGGPRAAMDSLSRVVSAQVDAWPEEQDRASARSELLDRATALGWPALPSGGGNYLLDMQQLAAAGDMAAVARELAVVDSLRWAMSPGSITVDAVLPEARLRLMAGDTARAVRELDGVLEHLPAASINLVGQVSQAASLVRAMVLRGRLAAAAGDVTRARHWLAVVDELWTGADPGPKMELEKLRRLTP